MAHDRLDVDALRQQAAGRGMSLAMVDVLIERHRQRAAEGFSSAHDDAYRDSELIRAALCYALSGLRTDGAPAHEARAHWLGLLWPWPWNWWKPKTQRLDLVRAAALLIAEIERIDRQPERPTI